MYQPIVGVVTKKSDGRGLRTVVTVVTMMCIVVVPIGNVRAEHAPASMDSDSDVVLSPLGDPYAPYLADPHRVDFEVLAMSNRRSKLPASGDSRIGLKAGGRFGIARYNNPEYFAHRWQLGIEFGFIGEFDLDRSYDNVGWDGIYGAVLTGPITRSVTAKLGLMHRSSHIGDEYIERTGFRRLNYTRDDALAGISWDVAPAWRLYGEYGHAFNLGNEVLQKKGRSQLGLEYHPKRQWWDGQIGWFAAIDVSAMEERDWKTDTAVRLGYLLSAEGGRRWTISGVYYHGRPSVSEFFQHTESYVGIAVRMDL